MMRLKRDFLDVGEDMSLDNNGFGDQGLKLLCRMAKENGLNLLYDDIAIDNPAVALFTKNGFEEEYRTDEIIILRKCL